MTKNRMNSKAQAQNMFKGANMKIAALLTALSVATATPAMANTDLLPGGYDAAITGAKKAMVADPAKALDLARNAKGMLATGQETAKKDRLIAAWLEGEALMRLNRGGEAAGVIGFALYEASQTHQDDKVYADLLRSSASLKARAGDPRDALKHFRMAQERYENLGDDRSCAIVLQNIGSLYARAGEFEQVVDHYQKAAKVFSDDGILSLSAQNNIGNALKSLGRFDEAAENFEQALAIAKGMGSPLLEARILTNLASAQQLGGDIEAADATAGRAMALAEEHAPDWSRFVHGVAAQIELKKGNIALAGSHISQTFEGQKLDSTDSLFREFHEAAAEIFAKGGNRELAELHTAAIERLDKQAKTIAL